MAVDDGEQRLTARNKHDQTEVSCVTGAPCDLDCVTVPEARRELIDPLATAACFLLSSTFSRSVFKLRYFDIQAQGWRARWRHQTRHSPRPSRSQEPACGWHSPRTTTDDFALCTSGSSVFQNINH